MRTRYVGLSLIINYFMLALLSVFIKTDNKIRPYEVDIITDVVFLNEDVKLNSIKHDYLQGDESLRTGIIADVIKEEEFFWIIEPIFSYPEEAKEKGYEGVVGLLLDVSEDGIIENAVIEKKSGHDILDLSAINDVYCGKIGFNTGKRDIQVRINVPYVLK